jgi:hypothetical protein
MDPTTVAPTPMPRARPVSADRAETGGPAPASRRRIDRAVLVHRLVVLLVVGFLLTGPGGILVLASPWSDVGHTHHEVSLELHRWHATEIAAVVTLLVCGTLIAAAWRPRRSQTLTQAALGSMAVFGAVGFFVETPAEVLVPVAAVIVLVAATSPLRRSLFRLAPSAGRRPIALVAAVVATPFLVTTAARNLTRQLGPLEEHAALGHWAAAAALAVALLALTWLAVRDTDGAPTLSGVLAVTYVYLGTAALVLPRHDGSWSTTGGLLALVLGVMSLAAVRRRPTTSRSHVVRDRETLR